MVFSALLNVQGTINLLEYHNACQMMRERHGRHGQANFSLALEPLIQAARATDQHRQLAGTGYG